jgi:hypothetical protein
MAKGPDGKTVRPDDDQDEETTRRVQRKSIRDRIASNEPGEAETHVAGSGDEDEEDTGPMGRGGGYVDEPTKMEDEPVQARPKPIPRAPSGEGEKTQIYRPKRAKAEATDADDGKKGADAPKGQKQESGDDNMAKDPVVGWIVVTDGPGRGASFPLGYGNNRIGRAPTETVSLDFGDTQISRENHATLTYDGKNRRYFVKEGDGRNLIYVGDDPVLVPVELKGGETLSLGDTKLRFVPFCGKEFDWHNQ